MAKIPTFSNQDPVIESTPLNPAGQGNEAIANMVANVSKTIVATSVQLKKATSNAILYNQNATVQNAKRDALTQIQLHPNNSAQISSDYRQHVDSISQNVKLSQSDQEKLTTLSRASVNQVDNATLLAGARQQRLTESINFRSDFPQTVTNISQQLISDPKAAQVQIESTNQLINDGLAGGFISPAEGINAKNSLNSIIDRHQKLSTFVKNGASQIDGLHALTGPHNENNGNLPTQAPTLFHYGVLNQNVSFNDAVAAAHKGDIDPGVISSLSPNNFIKYTQTLAGISNAQALINSGNHYDFIQKRFNVLNTTTASALSTQEKAERDQESFFIKNINNRNMLPALERTSQGNIIFSHYNNSVNAIMDNGVLSPEQKQKELQGQFSHFTNQIVSYSHAIGIPTDKINPIPESMSAGLNDAYNVNADPVKVTGMMDKFSRQNGVYLANSLKDPVQQETLNIANNLRGKNDNSFVDTMILATGKGRDFSDIKPVSGVTDNSIKQDIVNDNSELFTYLGAQPNGQNRISNVLKAAVNYVKFSGQRANDLSLSDYRDYEKEFGGAYKKSLSIDTGSNFQIDGEKVGTTHAQNQALGDYLTEEVKQQIRSSATASHTNALLDLSPLRVISTPDGHLMVMNDRNSQIGKKVLYTSELMAKAEGWEKQLNHLPTTLLSGQHETAISEAWDNYHPTTALEHTDIDFSKSKGQ